MSSLQGYLGTEYQIKLGALETKLICTALHMYCDAALLSCDKAVNKLASELIPLCYFFDSIIKL